MENCVGVVMKWMLFLAIVSLSYSAMIATVRQARAAQSASRGQENTAPAEPRGTFVFRSKAQIGAAKQKKLALNIALGRRKAQIAASLSKKPIIAVKPIKPIAAGTKDGILSIRGAWMSATTFNAAALEAQMKIISDSVVDSRIQERPQLMELLASTISVGKDMVMRIGPGKNPSPEAIKRYVAFMQKRILPSWPADNKAQVDKLHKINTDLCKAYNRLMPNNPIAIDDASLVDEVSPTDFVAVTSAEVVAAVVH
jgi:hypothetical protein